MVLGFLLGWLTLGPQVSQSGVCPEADLEARLGALLEASDADGDGWRVEAELEDEGLVLRIEDPSGGSTTRTLTSPDCAVAIDAAAFIVASAIDPTIAPPGDEPEPEEPEPEVPEPAVPEPEEPEPEPEEPDPAPPLRVEPVPPEPAPSRPRPEIWIGLGPGIMGGALPGPVGRLVLQASVERAWWRVRLDGAATLRSEARASAVSEVGARMGHWALGGRGCGVFRQGRFGLSGCAGLEAGQLYAEGFGFDGATSVRLPWGAALLAGGAEVRLGSRLRLWADAEVGLVLNRAEIVVDNLERLHQLGPVLGRGTLGLALRI